MSVMYTTCKTYKFKTIIVANLLKRAPDILCSSAWSRYYQEDNASFFLHSRIYPQQCVSQCVIPELSSIERKQNLQYLTII